MDSSDQAEDRSELYNRLATDQFSNSAPSSSKTRLQALGSGIVQRRYRMATESMVNDSQSVGLQSLSRSRTATSPLVNMVEPPNFLSKSVSFHDVQSTFSTRYIDETKIQKHFAQSKSCIVQQQKQSKLQKAREMTIQFGKAMYWFTILTGLIGIALSGSILFSATTSTWHKDFGKSPKFRKAAVASEQEICSNVGVGLLKRGGNALDAAIGSLLCVGVINNFSCGIGGGGFMLIRTNSSYSTIIDYRETAPSGVTLDDFGNDGNRLIEGGLSVAVPSQIKGLWKAHQEHGKLPWNELFDPSIALCEQGFAVTPKLAKVIARWAVQIEKSAAMKETYLKKADFHDSQKGLGGEHWIPKTEADIIKRPNLAETLKTVAKLGPEGFYKGPIAEAIVRENQANGGKLTLEDMEKYQPIERQPIVGEFKGFKVTTVGSPAAGAPLLQILMVLEKLKLNDLSPIKAKHLFIEALKFGYGARMKVADPDFFPEVLKDEVNWLNEETIASILTKIDKDHTHEPDYYTDVFDDVHDQGTTHLTVLDENGMAVSLTDTVNLEFGSFITDLKTGAIQNNEMGDFSLPNQDNSYQLPPSGRNYVGPGKRPVSSSTPIIFEKDGEVVLITGAAGGSRIISVTAQIIMDLLLLKYDPVKAMVDSRIHHQLLPNVVVVDHETSEALIEGLASYGHKVVVLPPDTSLTSLQLILRRKNGEIWALSDPRKGGLADGY